MLLHVQYQDSRYDYVDAAKLNDLIASKQIKKFLRASQNEWVDIESGSIRGEGSLYLGPERRQYPAMSW
jgi:hypothetical protein